jgi:hypothetical protein
MSSSPRVQFLTGKPVLHLHYGRFKADDAGYSGAMPAATPEKGGQAPYRELSRPTGNLNSRDSVP